MKITIVGGGNVGTQLAVHCADKGHEVWILTSKPHLFSDELYIVDDSKTIVLSGRIKKATEDEEEAISDAELVFVTVPAFAMQSLPKRIVPFLKDDAAICLIPGTGGGECVFSCQPGFHHILYGLQRVPSVARLVEYGKSVRASGYRGELHGAALRGNDTKKICLLISQLLDMPCNALPNYLSVTLTPSNQILHTVRLYSVFEDYHLGMTYHALPLFYEQWNNKSSALLLKCDDELQKICEALSEDGIDTRFVLSLRNHYNSRTTDELTKKITNIPALKGLKCPLINVGDGFVPDFESRYFLSDFPFGLNIILQIASFYNIDIPTMQEVYSWYKKVATGYEEFLYRDYGIYDRESFRLFYSG